MPYALRLAAVAATLLVVSVAGCSLAPEGDVTIEIPEPIVRDFDAILARDTLVVLTQFNSTSYFLYRGEPMGFEYEYLEWFVKEHDLHLKTVVVPNRDSLLVLLNEGVGDVVAARMTPTLEDSAYVGYTDPLYRTRPVVVQREAPLEAADVPEAVDSLLDSVASSPPDPADVADGPDKDADSQPRSSGERPGRLQDRGEPTIRARLVRRPDQLAGDSVHVLAGTRIEDRLIELSDDISGEIFVVEVDSGSAESLVRRVAEEELRYTVAHENIAELQESYYTNLVILPTVDQPYEVAWAVRKNAPALYDVLNAWIEGNPGLKDRLYQKYFIDREGYRERVADEYLASETGKLSPYDALFQEHAPSLGWDWRLLAAQSFQESRFDPRATSWAGAMGLLQLMPGTARQYGVGDAYEPAANVAGAARFLDWLQTSFWPERVPDETERLKFVLASYNAGPGHVDDARRLTEKYGGDPNVWEDVAYWLLRKSEREVYTDPVVRHGFCRGLEPVTYVARILDRYDHYLQFVDPSGAGAPPSAIPS
jgi:membrane-bound lytic murein transglycosylase F